MPCERVVARRDEAGVAEGAEVLARKKGEAAERADAAGGAAAVRRANRLRGILDNRHTSGGGGGDDRIHLGGQAEQVNRKERPGARRDRRAERVGPDVVRVEIDVDEHRPRADPRDGAGAREERVRGGDDLVAGADATRHQREQQRVGAGRHGDRVAHAEHRRHLALERIDLRPHDEALAVADARHRRQNLVP
jgi:hypothetical protein